MAHPDAIAGAIPRAAHLTIRKITVADLRIALTRGFDDFLAMPSHVVFLSLIYPVVGLLLGRLMIGYDLLPMIFPLVAGFALLGPFAALGLYELSRRRERGLPASWKHAFGVFRSPSIPAITALGFVLMVLFVAWLVTAEAIYAAIFGRDAPESATAFADAVLYTGEGHRLIVIGNAVGFLFALVTFTISVVSFPLLLDRPVSAITAVRTSVQAVLRNPFTMALWAIIVVALLVIGALPLLIGLAITMPVLGHSTWHLYRRVVAD